MSVLIQLKSSGYNSPRPRQRGRDDGLETNGVTHDQAVLCAAALLGSAAGTAPAADDKELKAKVEECHRLLVAGAYGKVSPTCSPTTR
jgi:hypothetical protein